jgi:hypothetical protein
MFITSLVAFGMFVATQDIEGVRDDFMAACKMHNLSDEQIADMLGIGRGQFADQKALRNHLSLWRVKNLTLGIQRTFWMLHGKRLGLVVLADSDLGEYLSERLQQFRKRRQLKMALSLERERASA